MIEVVRSTVSFWTGGLIRRLSCVCNNIPTSSTFARHNTVSSSRRSHRVCCSSCHQLRSGPGAMKQFTKLLPIEPGLVPFAPKRRFAGCNKRCYEGAAILSVNILNSAQAGGLEAGVRFPCWVLPRKRGPYRRQQQCQHLSYSRSLRLELRFSFCTLPRYQEPLCSQQRYQHLRSPRAFRLGLLCGSARVHLYLGVSRRQESIVAFDVFSISAVTR